MDNKFIRVDEVAQELFVSKPYAYKLIKKLNDELKEQGFITIAGRVNHQYFQESYRDGNPYYGIHKFGTDVNIFSIESTAFNFIWGI